MFILRIALVLALVQVLSASTCGTDDPCDLYSDVDGDGVASIACGGEDCDDDDADRFPGNSERCSSFNDEQHDEDCNPSTYGHRDGDGDGSVDATCCNVDIVGIATCGDDCDDSRNGSHPGAPEVCDILDNDCDGLTDEDVLLELYADQDGDGYGAGNPESGCFLAPGVSYLGNDCDDTNAAIVPGEMHCIDAANYEICENGVWSVKAVCPGQGICRSEPNGTGVCL